MEIDEVAARVVRSYWALLLAMTVVPLLLVGYALHGKEQPYEAKTRLQASSRATDAAPGDAGVSIVVSQVKAFATSRNLLDRVLKAERLNRDPVKLAKGISVTGLGTSTIVEMSVKDLDPAVARRLTDRIGAAVVDEINTSNQGALLRQIKDLDKQISALTKKLAPLARKAGAVPVPDIGAANERERISSELTDLRADRTELRTQLAAAGTASVVQPAILAPRQDPAMMMSIIAALVGLVGGILIAVGIETFRPTVPGPHRVARRLGTPLLGHADQGPAALADLGRRIRLAAKRAGVERVTLVAAGGEPVPADLVSRIAAAVYGDDTKVVNATPPPPAKPSAEKDEDEDPDAEPATGSNSISPNSTGGHPIPPSTSVVRSATTGTAVLPKRSAELSKPGAAAAKAPARAHCHVHAFEDIDPGADDQVGVVAVAGPVTSAAAVESVRDLITASGWPLLGVIATTRKIKR